MLVYRAEKTSLESSLQLFSRLFLLCRLLSMRLKTPLKMPCEQHVAKLVRARRGRFLPIADATSWRLHQAETIPEVRQCVVYMRCSASVAIFMISCERPFE